MRQFDNSDPNKKFDTPESFVKNRGFSKVKNILAQLEQDS